MADPHWTSYVGMITGIIGSLTGIAGAIMGYISYRKSNQNKTFDLRMTIKRIFTDTESDLMKLKDQMNDARISRESLTAARGVVGSSDLDYFRTELIRDQKTTEDLKTELKHSAQKYDELGLDGLERELVEVQRIHRTVQRLSGKYNDSISRDRELMISIRNIDKPRL